MHRTNSLIILCFWSLAAICCWNLNGIAVLVTGKAQLFSLLILGCCGGLFVFSKERNQVFSEPACISYVLFMIGFMGVAGIQRVDIHLLRAYSASLLIVVAAAIGARSMLISWGLEKFLICLTAVATLGACTIFLSPYLQEYYKNISNAEVSFRAGRWNGFFVNPNAAGFAGVYAALAAVCGLTNARTGSKAINFCMICLVIVTISILLTYSRGAVITFLALISGVVYLAIKQKRTDISPTVVRRARFAAGFGALLLAGVVVFVLFSAEVMELNSEQRLRVQSIKRMLQLEETSNQDRGGRSELAMKGIDYWSTSPISGHGLGSLSMMPIRFGGIGCHNLHVAILGESGVIGFTMYIAFILVYCNRVRKLQSPLPVRVFLWANLGVLVLHGMVSHNVLDHRIMNLFWGVCIGILSVTDPTILRNGTIVRTRN